MQLSELPLFCEHIKSLRTIYSIYTKARQTVNFLCLQYPVLYIPIALHSQTHQHNADRAAAEEFWVDLALPDSPPYYLSLSHLIQSLLQPDFQCSGKQGWIRRLGLLKVHQVTLGWMAGDQGLSPWQQAWASVQGGLQRSKEIPARPTQIPERAAHPKSEKLLLNTNESFCPRRADSFQSRTS